MTAIPLLVFLVGITSTPPADPGPHAHPAPVSPEASSTGAEVVCGLCEKPIPRGEEVLLETEGSGAKPYRCVHCALIAQAAESEPSTIRVRSPLSATVITIRRDEEGWEVSPSTAVFLSLPEEGGECMDRHRAFPDREEYERYLRAHPELPRTHAVPYGIDQLAELLEAGLPPNGIRPDAPVQLLVVGMVTHLPFREEVLPAIEGALADVGEQVGARFVDATQPAGKAILAAHGVHEHLPVVIFLNGSSHTEVAGREIDLRGFPGTTWTRDDLTAVLRQQVDRL